MGTNANSTTYRRRLIIMPAYNESENLPKVIPGARRPRRSMICL